MILQRIRERVVKSADRSIRFFRLTVFLLVCMLGVSWWLARKVEAQVGEVLLGLGAQMMRLEGSTQGEPARVAFNGLHFNVLQGSVARPMDDVLDEFEGRCERGYRAMHSEMRELVASDQLLEHEEQLPEGAAPHLAEEAERFEREGKFGTLRKVDGLNGFVACFAPSEDEASPAGLLANIERYSRSADLSAFGDMRYVFVQGYEEEGEDRTHVVGLWTDDPIVMSELFPADRDAPGHDPEGLGRPPGSRRMISAAVEGQPYGLFLYHREGAHLAGTLTFLRRDLEERGWHIVPPTEDTRELSEGEMLHAIAGERVVSYVVRETEQATLTSVLLAEADPSSP